MRRIFAALVVTLVFVALTAGCAAFRQKKVEKTVKADAPINCATAEGDIRVLQAEKAHVAQRVVEGATALAPAGAVLGILTGTEGTKLKVAVGEYDKAIDKRIAEIEQKCGA